MRATKEARIAAMGEGPVVGEDLTRTLETLTALAEFEQALAGMYAACGDVWTEDGPLFAKLEKAEADHAACMRRISRILKRNPERFSAGRPLTAAAARCQIDYVNARTDEFRSGDVARRTALLAMREIERSILETRFHEIVKTDDEDYLRLAGKLHDETQAHVDALEQRLRSNGNGGGVTAR